MTLITRILQDGLNEDKNIRYTAEGNLKQLQQHDPPNFLLSLKAELSSDESPPDCRRLAGTILRNLLDDRFCADGDLPISQWISLDQLIKSKIKESLLVTLGSLVPQAWNASSQVIAKVAYVEIPRREWPDLIGKLLSNMSQQSASPPLKQATLEALGSVFDEILELDPGEVNAVLNAVIQAMNQAELSSKVRLAAVKALQSVLKHANFANDDCRNLIMSAIRDTAESAEAEMIKQRTLVISAIGDSAEFDKAKMMNQELFVMGAISDTHEFEIAKKIKQEAFSCLVVIASKYYTMLEPYMETILSLTTESLKGGVKSGTLQCIAFWITICEKVIELREQNKDHAHAISAVDCRFIEKPLSTLVPFLLQTLLKQEGDDDAQSIFMSGATCLGLVARTIENGVVPLALQFVEGNIKVSDWQRRKAATSALGVILDGPSIEKLAPIVCLLLDRMEDPNMEVRGTAACTLRQLFELHSPARANRIFTDANLRRIVAVLAMSSKDVPEVSEEACRAIYFLAKGYTSISSELDHSKKEISSELDHSKKEISSELDYSKEEISSELSPFVSDIFDVLVSTSELDKESPFRLPTSTSAYEALCEVVSVSNIQDYKPLMAIGVLMPFIMRRLNTVLDANASSSGDERNKHDLLALLCGLLHVIIKKLGKTLKVWRIPFLLLLLCRVLPCKCPTARDEAALAIGALAEATGPHFADHMPILLQYLDVKLLFPTYLRVIGNIFRVLGERILPYSDDIMDVLYEGLSKSMLKPPILECFGVIAPAIGKSFEKYLQAVMEKLKEAANPRYYANVFDEDKVDYGNQLRQGILKAYSGILNSGIKDRKSWLKVLMDLIKFTEAVCEDQSRDASVVTPTTAELLSSIGLMVESWTQRLIPEDKGVVI